MLPAPALPGIDRERPGELRAGAREPTVAAERRRLGERRGRARTAARRKAASAAVRATAALYPGATAQWLIVPATLPTFSRPTWPMSTLANEWETNG